MTSIVMAELVQGGLITILGRLFTDLSVVLCKVLGGNNSLCEWFYDTGDHATR